MTEATEQLVNLGAPFKPFHRWPHSQMSGWSVRDKHGYDLCLCDDEDAAHAIAEALNEGRAQSEKSKAMT